MDNQSRDDGKLNAMLAAVGVGLIFCGVVVLVGVAVTGYRVLSEPAQVPFIQWFMVHVQAESRAFFGHMAVPGNPEALAFDINVAPSARTFGLLGFGLVVLGLFGSVAKAMIWGGVEIIKAVRPRA